MTTIQFGVPQGSVLGPILFVLCTADVIRLVKQHGFRVHQYADDTQLYGCCEPGNSASLCHDLSICVDNVAQWMHSNHLQLNAGKTEFMWCVPPAARCSTISDHTARICRCWPESMEQSTSCCSLLCHIQHLQKGP